MNEKRRPQIKAFNAYIFNCSLCGREIPLETDEERHAATRDKGVCEYCYAALDSSEQTIAEHAPQFDIGERVVLVTFPDQRGAVTECDVFGSVTVRLDDGCTGHFPIRDLAAECCLQDLRSQLAQAHEQCAKIAESKHTQNGIWMKNIQWDAACDQIAAAIRAARSEPVANAQAPEGQGDAEVEKCAKIADVIAEKAEKYHDTSDGRLIAEIIRRGNNSSREEEWVALRDHLRSQVQKERELSDALAVALKLADCRCWLLAKNKCAKCQALAQCTASRSEKV